MSQTANRVLAVPNKAYQPNGPKSFVNLLRKYNITPTLAGPYYRVESESKGNRHGQGLRGLRKHKHYHHHHHGKCPGGSAPTTPTGESPPPTDPDSGPSRSTPPLANSNPNEPGTEVESTDVQNDSLYTTPVVIGGQTFNLDFDSGSSDLWVFSTAMPAATVATLKSNNNSLYNPATSGTPVAGATWEISYGDGSSASGKVNTDRLTIGGLTIPDQEVEYATTASSSFTNDSATDGLLGLAMPLLNTVTPTPAPTPVQNLITQHDVRSGIFTVWLSSAFKDLDEADKGKSFYTFGNVDANALKLCNATDFYYTPVIKNADIGEIAFWQFTSQTVTINGTVHKRASPSVVPPALEGTPNSAIADTGTTLMLMDDPTCALIYKAIPGAYYDATQQGWLYPAKTTEAHLPTVGIDVGDKTFYIFKECLGFAPIDSTGKYVYGGIQSRGTNDFDIMGDVFLRSVYCCFDQSNMRFGCVQRTIQSNNYTFASS